MSANATVSLTEQMVGVADTRITPQARKVLAHLRSGKSITPMEALVVFNISRLASCIHEIKHKAKQAVDCTIRKDEAGHKYARYTILNGPVRTA